MKEKCTHTKLFFGSGGYFVFCRECGAQWSPAHEDNVEEVAKCMTNEVDTSDERVEPT